MTWLALADHSVQRFSRRGLGIDRSVSALFSNDPNTILHRGSIVMETEITGEGRPENLIGFEFNTAPARRSFKLSAIPGGGIALVQSFGSEVRHASVLHGSAGRTEILRTTLSWDASKKWARIVVERPGGVRMVTTEINDPLPFLLEDMRQMILDQTALGQPVVFVALSDEIEPVGPSPGLTPDIPVSTPFGGRPVGELKRGDTVYTRENGIVPVLHTVRRCVPAAGQFRPVRLRAPYFGLRRDVSVAPTQRLILTGTEVEYNFGQEAVLSPAGHLVNGTAALSDAGGPIVEYVQLLLPGHEALDVCGCHLESLYVGRMRRDPQRLGASILAELENRSIPEHARPIHKVLGSFEAVTLAAMRAA